MDTNSTTDEVVAEATVKKYPRLTTLKYFELSYALPSSVVEAYNDVLSDMLSEHLPEPFKAAFSAYALSAGHIPSLGIGDLDSIAEGYSALRAHLVRTGAIPVPADFPLSGDDEPKVYDADRLDKLRTAKQTMQCVIEKINAILFVESAEGNPISIVDAEQALASFVETVEIHGI